ncbi:hypothetical protein [Azospirillum sp. Sh1]|uniref:hypothetical protein n=1 Tax=Azospirillum sp. Sh1 TaxID=2607285 RepID=UPI0011EE2082|nr:hypothetical protein [Azospirillum sp. Sh1]KAA0573182.1 hypothetical protein FZ029_21205 [Azospirillum sp. Sh1]
MSTAESADTIAAPDASPLEHVQRNASYWRSPDQRLLSYWINVRSFCGPDPAKAQGCERADKVAAHLSAAAKDWTDACADCGVRFERVEDRTMAVFAVQYVAYIRKDGGLVPAPYLAHAFYPSSAVASRILRIGPAYWQSSYDPAGILRHELGHILGYVHEHRRPGANQGACFEQPESLPPAVRRVALTEYDPRSIMRPASWCDSPGDRHSLAISERDIAGHRALYGPPP